jgi:hypothetical protein
LRTLKLAKPTKILQKTVRLVIAVGIVMPTNLGVEGDTHQEAEFKKIKLYS